MTICSSALRNLSRSGSSGPSTSAHVSRYARSRGVTVALPASAFFMNDCARSRLPLARAMPQYAMALPGSSFRHQRNARSAS